MAASMVCLFRSVNKVVPLQLSRTFQRCSDSKPLCLQPFLTATSVRLCSQGSGDKDPSSNGINENNTSSSDAHSSIPSLESTTRSRARPTSSDRSKSISDELKVSKTKSFSPTEGALDKFAKVVDKVKQAQLAQSQFDDSNPDLAGLEVEDENESFASMFRRSKFASLGEHKGRLLQGEIIEVMEDDLYIDFGGKFHCVCPRPKRNGDRYHRGTKVLLNLQSMEMSSSFLGSDIHVTLLEADATLLGLVAVQRNKGQGQRNPSQSQPRTE